ncbi:MAG: SdiA-regulated domain-containing protein [Candidatus Cloacimonadota bacterium]|nr:SdiA-regulated domain-containing protein [Candidatus Cloacimonadota bacterium]
MIEKIFFLITVITILLLPGCSLEETANNSNTSLLKIIEEYELDVPEPSGLTYDSHSNTLWTVSDRPDNKVYQIDFQGNILTILNYQGEDLEGIEYDANDSTLWIIEEGERKLVHIDLNGNFLTSYNIQIEGLDNNGLEANCIDDEHNFYLLNEKNPGLFIELNSDFSIKSEIELTNCEDYSGMCFDKTREGFWIVSDQSRKLFFYSIEHEIGVDYNLPFDKAEGVVYISEESRFYIVSDSEQKLYVCEINE